MKLENFDRFSKNTQVSNFMNIRAVGSELFHTDGQTDMTKIRFDFRSFAKERNKEISFPSRTHGNTFPIIPYSVQYIRYTVLMLYFCEQPII